MNRLASILASALLLAAIVTELSSRFWPGDYFALLCLTAVALILNGFFVARIAERGAAPTPQDSKPSRNQQSGNKSSGRNNDRNNGRNAGTGRGQAAEGSRGNDRGDGKKRGGQSGQRGSDRGRGDQRGRDNKREDRAKQDDKRSTPPKPAPAPPPGDVEQGIVKWFNRSKGYGFVVRENGEEIFVHQRSIVGSGPQRPVLHDDQKVSFVVVAHEKGPQAEHVTPL